MLAVLMIVWSPLFACGAAASCSSSDNGVGDVRITTSRNPSGGFLIRFQSDRACGKTEILVYPGDVNGQNVLLLGNERRYAIVGSADGRSFDETVEVPAELRMLNGEVATVTPDLSMIGIRRGGAGVAGPLTLQTSQ